MIGNNHLFLVLGRGYLYVRLPDYWRLLIFQGAEVERYFNTKELSEYLRIKESTIRYWVYKNVIPFCPIHGVIRFRLSEIEKWVKEQEEKNPALLSSKLKKELLNEMEIEEKTNGMEKVQECETVKTGDSE
jgi:excisionase family DNA binding protein